MVLPPIIGLEHILYHRLISHFSDGVSEKIKYRIRQFKNTDLVKTNIFSI